MVQWVWGSFLLNLLLDDVLRNLFMGPFDRALGSSWWTTPGGSRSLSKLIWDYQEFRTQVLSGSKERDHHCANKDLIFCCMCTMHAAEGKYLTESQLSLSKLKMKVSWSRKAWIPKNIKTAWPVWLSWLEHHHPLHKRSWVRFPGKADTYLGCGFNPWLGREWEAHCAISHSHALGLNV